MSTVPPLAAVLPPPVVLELLQAAAAMAIAATPAIAVMRLIVFLSLIRRRRCQCRRPGQGRAATHGIRAGVAPTSPDERASLPAPCRNHDQAPPTGEEVPGTAERVRRRDPVTRPTTWITAGRFRCGTLRVSEGTG